MAVIERSVVLWKMPAHQVPTASGDIAALSISFADKPELLEHMGGDRVVVFWYDCKVVTSVPFVTVYGSDYSYFWGWDKTIARDKSGVGTKTATAVGAGSFKQCGNFGFGEACMSHDSAKITIHMFADGTFGAVGH